MILSPTELLALVRRHGANPGADRVAVAAALAESGGNTESVGDGGASWGLWQMHERGLGAGLSRAARCDPDQAAAVMVPQFNHWYAQGQALGHSGERLARYAYVWAERPYGFPDLDCAAASAFARHWRALEETPTVHPLANAWIAAMRRYTGKPYRFGGKSPAESFDCSGLLTHCAREAGFDLGDPYYTPADGLKEYGTRTDDPQPGDIVLFHSTYGSYGRSYATHCGVYLGGGRMLDTHGNPWPGVGETNLSDGYWSSKLLGYWRPHAYAQAAPEPPPDRCAELESYVSALTHDVLPAVLRELRAPKVTRAAIERCIAALTPHAVETE